MCVCLGDPSLPFQSFPWYLGNGLFSSDGVFLGPKKQLSVSLFAQTAEPSVDKKMCLMKQRRQFVVMSPHSGTFQDYGDLS